MPRGQGGGQIGSFAIALPRQLHSLVRRRKMEREMEIEKEQKMHHKDRRADEKEVHRSICVHTQVYCLRNLPSKVPCTHKWILKIQSFFYSGKIPSRAPRVCPHFEAMAGIIYFVRWRMVKEKETEKAKEKRIKGHWERKREGEREDDFRCHHKCTWTKEARGGGCR